MQVCASKQVCASVKVCNCADRCADNQSMANVAAVLYGTYTHARAHSSASRAVAKTRKEQVDLSCDASLYANLSRTILATDLFYQLVNLTTTTTTNAAFEWRHARMIIPTLAALMRPAKLVEDVLIANK